MSDENQQPPSSPPSKVSLSGYVVSLNAVPKEFEPICSTHNHLGHIRRSGFLAGGFPVRVRLEVFLEVGDYEEFRKQKAIYALCQSDRNHDELVTEMGGIKKYTEAQHDPAFDQNQPPIKAEPRFRDQTT